MTKISGKYLGELRSELTHHQSGTIIYTDAPLDNNGKGESFSPTDLLAAALASCMLTIMGIRARSRNIKLGTPTYNIVKSMRAAPRQVSKIDIEINMNSDLNHEDRDYLEREAKSCPVALSLNKELVQEVQFNYN